jgi:RNA polymerase sigma-70 factor (ECF subfamily)
MMMTMNPAKDDSYPTRLSLLSRLKNTQDHSSWQTFNDIYGRLIFRFAIKNGLTEDEADEVVQETLIGVAKYLPGFRYDPKVCAFKTWLLNFTAWRVQDQVRKRKAPGAAPSSPTRAAMDEDPNRTATVERVPDPAGNQLEAIWDQEWREAALGRVKARVDARQWQIFDLYVLKQWPVADVAKTLGVSAGRVYIAKHRISRLLKKELEALERS